MLDHPEDALGLAGRQRVIKRRAEVEQNDRRREYAHPGNESGVTLAHCMHDQKWNTDECGDQRCPVADAVRYFLAQRLRAFGAGGQWAHAAPSGFPRGRRVGAHRQRVDLPVG